MIRLTLSLIVAAFLWTVAAPQAHAQALCGDRAELRRRMRNAFSPD